MTDIMVLLVAIFPLVRCSDGPSSSEALPCPTLLLWFACLKQASPTSPWPTRACCTIMRSCNIDDLRCALLSLQWMVSQPLSLMNPSPRFIDHAPLPQVRATNSTQLQDHACQLLVLYAASHLGPGPLSCCRNRLSDDPSLPLSSPHRPRCLHGYYSYEVRDTGNRNRKDRGPRRGFCQDEPPSKA